jgi:hypothetical protein
MDKDSAHMASAMRECPVFSINYGELFRVPRRLRPEAHTAPVRGYGLGGYRQVVPANP